MSELFLKVNSKNFFFLHLLISKPQDKRNIFSTEMEIFFLKDTAQACTNATQMNSPA